MVGFVKKILGHLGLWRDENNERQQHNQQPSQHNQNILHQPSVNNSTGPSKGFRMKMAVNTDNVSQGPIVYQCWGNEGGVQGFRWYSQKLQADEDGDIAEEFLNEVLPDSSDLREFPRLEVKHGTKPVILKGPVVSRNGNVHQCVEHAGRLLWA